MTNLIKSIADTVTERTPKFTVATRKRGDECVGRRLRLRRRSFETSEKELRQKLGIDPNDLNAYEQGTKRVGANLLPRIAKLLHVGLDDFFRGYTPEEQIACLD